MRVCLPDTSCLIHLDRIGHLDLLVEMYEDCCIPPAVRDEFGRVPEGMRIRTPTNSALIRMLRRTVDRGEAELIARGTEIEGAHLILDDRAARREAIDLECSVIGTVGIVLRAKQNGVLESVRPVLDALYESGFWMTEALYNRALRKAGEGDEGGK